MHSNMPPDELKRSLHLAEYNLDYTSLEDDFKDLATLAASIAGTDISIINLIDTYTQWSVASHGHSAGQTPREQTVCQYTIGQEDHFEVADLPQDPRFKDMPFATGDAPLRYYYGVPLRSREGYALGSLCVIDTKPKQVPAEKTKLLAIVAQEIIKRLEMYRQVEQLTNRVQETIAAQRVVAHDIRGPLAGIIGLAEVISSQAEKNTLKDVQKFATLIFKSGHSLLDLSGEIFETSRQAQAMAAGETLTMALLQEKLERLYQPQAENKQVLFSVSASAETENIPVQRRNLLQIAGNLTSNAIKFTPRGGQVHASLQLQQTEAVNTVTITVTHSGNMSPENIEAVNKGEAPSITLADGEKSFDYGLAVVKKLVGELGATMAVNATPGQGTSFTVHVILQRLS